MSLKVCAVDVGLTTGVAMAEIDIVDGKIDYKFIDCVEYYKELDRLRRTGDFMRYAKRYQFDEYWVEYPKRDSRATRLLHEVEEEVQWWEHLFLFEPFENKVFTITPGVWKTSSAVMWPLEQVLPEERLPGKMLALSKHERDAMRVIYWRALQLKTRMRIK